jgi:hypothetical protein
VPVETILERLPEFTGVDRRLTLRGRVGDVTVLDDYAHHPTEIKASLSGIRERYRPGRLWCVFQPHQYSRTRFLLEDFAESFKLADVTIVPEIYFVRDSQENRQAVNAQVLVDRLRGMGFAVSLLDIGGGYAADYEEGKSPPAAAYAARIVPLLAGKGLEFVIEPGRQISANSGILLARVLYVKKGGERTFVIVDAAMTDLIRPALYGAEHFVYPSELIAGVPAPERKMGFTPPGAIRCDVVGGVCESSDFLAKDRMLPPVRRGELLTVFSAGAYAFSMSSQYNTRPRAAEVLVEGSRWRIIRRRETYDDLVAPER